MTATHAALQVAHRRQLANELRALQCDARRRHVTQTVIDTGGTLILPNPRSTTQAHYAEISILGLYHSGETLDEAIANWIKAADRATDTPNPSEAPQ